MDFLDHIGLPHMQNEALNRTFFRFSSIGACRLATWCIACKLMLGIVLAADGPLARFLPKAVVAVQREYLKIAKHAEMLPEGAEAASSKASPVGFTGYCAD